MRKIWLFRILIFFAPFIALIILFGLLEIGFRIYATINGPFFVYPPSLKSLSSSPSLANAKFALPTHLLEKTYHNGVWLTPLSENLDITHAHLQWKEGQNVFSLPPNQSAYLSKKLSSTGEVVFNVLVETDEYGQRKTPLGKQKNPTHHLIFLGCSFVMGEGVQPNETLPFYTANATNTYRSYNLGIYGGTISEAWVYTNTSNNFNSVKEQKGYGIYVFLDDHISRYKGNTQYLGTWLAGRPLVRPGRDGKVHLLGTWAEARPWLLQISKWIESSVFLTAINFSVPSINEGDIEDFVKVIASVREAYWKKFGSENPFVVVLYFQNAVLFAPQVKAQLEKAQIQYLDYTPRNLENLSDQNLRIHPNDGHPNALAHKIVGELIAEDLKLQ